MVNLGELIQKAVLLPFALAAGIFVVAAVYILEYSEVVELADRFVVMMMYSFWPTNVFALFVEGVIAILGSSFVASKIESNWRAVAAVVVGVFLYVSTNLLFNWMFPPM